MYGIDLSDGCLDTRSWRWLSTRILGLIDRTSDWIPLADGSVRYITRGRTRLARALYPDRIEKE